MAKKKFPRSISKMVLDRKRAARELKAALKVHRDALAEGIEARLAPLLAAGEPMTDVRHLVDLLDRDLDRAFDLLEGAADSHSDRKRDALRRGRETRTAQRGLRSELIDMRRAIAGIYGADRAGEVHGLSGDTARGSFELAEQGRRAVHFLSRPVSELPSPRTEGVAVDLEPWLSRLRPLAERLAALLDEPPWEQRTVHEKQQALAEFDDTFARLMRIAGGLYWLAGLENLWRRLRKDLQLPKRMRTGEDSDEEGGDEDGGAEDSEDEKEDLEIDTAPSLWSRIWRKIRLLVMRSRE